MFNIRPLERSQAEYEAVVDVRNAVWPDYPTTLEELKHYNETRDPQYLFERLVVEVAGKIVGHGIYCEPWWSMKPGKYYINIEVHPDYRRRGIGTAFYDHVMGILIPLTPTLFTADTREDQADALRSLAQRGYQSVMRLPTSHLDVVRFDPTRFAEAIARVKERGIRIVPLSQIAAQDHDWKRKYWELDWELMQDVPSPDPPTQQAFEIFEQRLLGAPGFNPDSQFIALAGERWVGMSGLWIVRAEPEKLSTGLTGVVRDYRRQGIATAMKVRAIRFAEAYGAKIIETDNEENNPMYFLNLKLGFEPQPAWLEFEKKIKSEGDENGIP